MQQSNYTGPSPNIVKTSVECSGKQQQMILINCGNFSMFVSEAGHYKDGGEGSLHFDVDSSLSLHNSIYTNLHFIMNNEHGI